MILFWTSFVIYTFGCFCALAFFLIGRAPALDERNWRWPVIFLWPLLVFWPVHVLAGAFIRRQTRKPK